MTHETAGAEAALSRYQRLLQSPQMPFSIGRQNPVAFERKAA